MKFRIISAALAVALLAACPFSHTEPGKKKAKGKYDTDKPPKPTKDESGDITFQSFVGRLRTAVLKRDVDMLASLMTPDFGYRWETPPPGENVFAYWDQNNSWPKLAALMNEPWVPYDGFMVVPPALAQRSDYDGYRAGVRMVNGSWRFSYFVPAPPPDPANESPAPTSL